MVKALFARPSSAFDLFDRLVGNAGAATTNSAERSMLRPLLPYYADTPTPGQGSTGDDGSPGEPSTSPEAQMQHQPHAMQVILAPQVSRTNEAPIEIPLQDAVETPALRAGYETRSVNSRDPPGISTQTPLNQHSVRPGQRMANTPMQARSAVGVGVQAADFSPHAMRPPFRDAGLHVEQRREHPLPRVTPKLSSFLQPVQAVPRDRSASFVSPLPRPASLRAEPTIEIHIGRIEVRAQASASPPAAPTPRAAAASTSSLAAHLGARGRGARS